MKRSPTTRDRPLFHRRESATYETDGRSWASELCRWRFIVVKQRNISRSETAIVSNALNDSSVVAQRCSILAHNDKGAREGTPHHGADTGERRPGAGLDQGGRLGPVRKQPDKPRQVFRRRVYMLEPSGGDAERAV